LAQCLGELLRVAHRAERAHAAERAQRAAGAGAEAARTGTPGARTARARTTGRVGVVAPRAEAEGRLSHLPGLSGRMEGSTLAKLSQEGCAMSNRVAQVRHERSPDNESTQQSTSRRRPRKNAERAASPADGPAEEAKAELAGLAEPELILPDGPRSGPVVAVTGAARGLGLALTGRLKASAQVGRVVAIDDHRGDVTGVTWRVVDVRDPALAGRLAGVDVIVHTDVDLAPATDARERRAFNVRGAQTVLTAAAAGRVGRAVLVTSAMVYGARPDNPVPLEESAPPAPDLDGSVVGDLLEIEQLARRSAAAHPGLDVTV